MAELRQRPGALQPRSGSLLPSWWGDAMLKGSEFLNQQVGRLRPYVGPHGAQGLTNVGNVGRLATEFVGPQADVLDMTRSSADVMTNLQAGNYGSAARDMGYAAAAPLFLLMPGSVGQVRKGSRALQSALTDPPPLTQSPLGFTSTIENAAQNLSQAKMTGEQARSMLLKGGAKPDELFFSGMDDFLEGRPLVTPDEIRAFNAENMVEVREVTLGGSADVRGTEGWTPQRFEEAIEQAERHDEWDEVARLTRAQEETSGFGPAGAPKFADPRWQLPGGENYREVLLVRPKKPMSYEEYAAEYRTSVPEIDEQTIRERYPDYAAAPGDDLSPSTFTGGHYGFDYPNVIARFRINDRVGPNGKRIMHVEEIQNDWAQAGRQARDNKVKALMESEGITKAEASARVPSDAGFVPRELTPTVGATSPQLPENYTIEQVRWLDDGEGNIPREITDLVSEDGYVVLDGRTDLVGWGETREAAVRNFDSDIDGPITFNAQQAGTVPRGPFVGTADKWITMALRRIIRKAVDEGYDRITITPGQVQVDRYDLSKQVSNIEIRDLDGGRVIQVNDLEGNPLYTSVYDEAGKLTSAGQYQGRDLSALIGKELGEKVMDVPPAGQMNWRVVNNVSGNRSPNFSTEAEAAEYIAANKFPEGTVRISKVAPSNTALAATFAGEDLKIGGEWAFEMYDKIIPKNLRKILKKLDPEARLGTTQLGDAPEWRPVIGEGQQWRVMDENQNYMLDPDTNRRAVYGDEAAARKALEDRPGGTEVWSVDITPAMRAAAAKGQSMFSVGALVAGGAAGAAGAGMLAQQGENKPGALEY